MPPEWAEPFFAHGVVVQARCARRVTFGPTQPRPVGARTGCERFGRNVLFRQIDEALSCLSLQPLSTSIRLQERAIWSTEVRRPDLPRRDLGTWVISRPSNF